MEVTQQHQLALIKRWFKKNGFKITTAVVTVAIVVIAWSWWQNSQRDFQEQASATFIALQQAIKNNDVDQVNALNNRLNLEFSETPYALSGRFISSKFFYDNGSIMSAIDELHALLSTEPEDIIRQIATNRLARLYLENKQPDKTLQVVAEQLSYSMGQSALSHFYIIQSDAYLQQNQPVVARQSLELAKKNLHSESPLAQVIELKLNNLPR